MYGNVLIERIGEKIRFIREKRGLSQEEVCNRLKTVKRTSLSEYENGVHVMNHFTFLELCRALEINPDVFLSELVKDTSFEISKQYDQYRKSDSIDQGDFIISFLKSPLLKSDKKDFNETVRVELKRKKWSYKNFTRQMKSTNDRHLKNEAPIPSRSSFYQYIKDKPIPLDIFFLLILTLEIPISNCRYAGQFFEK